jgi:hypothetical protein
MTVSILATRLIWDLRGSGAFLGKRTLKDVINGSNQSHGSNRFLTGTAMQQTKIRNGLCNSTKNYYK